MHTLHTLNTMTHILFGTIGLGLGLLAILFQNQRQRHIRYGRYFLYALTVVVFTAFIGIALFRANSVLLLLTLLSGYVGYSGYRTVRLRERRASGIDALLALMVLTAGGLFLWSLQTEENSWSPAVIYPTLSALGLVAGYDLVKYFWLYRRLKTWWLYEHIYKMLSAYSAILSAFSGTVLVNFKPYSQIVPSVICVFGIIYFIGKRARRRKPAQQRRSGAEPA
ncbi:hypothetical protein [Spirosoma koreense]